MSSTPPPPASPQAPPADSPDRTRQSRRDAGAEEQMAAPPKLRRRPMLIALSVLLTALGAILAAWLLTKMAGTTEVVAVKQDIQRGQVIREEDLTRADISLDNAVNPVPWDQRRRLFDQYATVDMPTGSLVVRDTYGASTVPGKGQSVVGLLIQPGRMPSSALKNGDQVTVVAATTDDASTRKPVVGRVAKIERAPDGRATVVDVIVPSGDAASLAMASIVSEVSIVLNTRDADEQKQNEANAESSRTSPSPSPSS